jgi:hypothetical protein
LLPLLLVFACQGREPAPTTVAAVPPETAETADAPAGDTTPEAAVHGELTTVGGQRVLRVWGTPRQMGFAHGALLRDEVLQIVDGYALHVIPPAMLDSAGVLYDTTADIPPRLREEAEGLVEGMRAHGGAFVPGLDRDLAVRDLLVLNAMTDLLAIGCSSVSAWGEATADDATLAGAPIVVRNLDWSDDAPLLRNQLLIIVQPDDPTRQPVASVAFAGYLGCLSCMNEAGVTALFNMGYGEGAASLAGALAGFSPANLMLRDVMERRDIDGDHRASADDVEAGVRAATHAGSWILHVLEPGATAGAASPARILEVEADGVVRRDPDATLGPTALAATNHLRKKATPRPGTRWRQIERTASRQGHHFTPQQLWQLGTSLRLPEVVYTLLAEPDARRLGLWLRRPGDAPDTDAEPVVHDLRALMAAPPSR